VAELLLCELIKLARKKLAVLRISPDFQSADSWLEELLTRRCCQPATEAIQHTSTMRLDLRKTPEELISAMRRSRRFEVRKFEREKPPEWTISFERSNENLATFHQMYSETLKRQGNSYKSLTELQQLSEHLEDPKMNLALMYYQDKPVAGAILLGHGQRLWYLYGGSVKGDKLISKAGVYLQWEIIKWSKTQGYTEYDLHGMPLESKPGDPFHGVYTFKKGFGGQIVELIGEFNYSPVPMLERLLEKYLQKI
jgi:peptidoglycan pentaglycine glycine transferase (the first glycine)